jgi:hypothetical protein
VLYPSPGVYHFPLVREEDALYCELFCIPPPRRAWYDDEEGDDGDSVDYDDLDDYDFV